MGSAFYPYCCVLPKFWVPYTSARYKAATVTPAEERDNAWVCVSMACDGLQPALSQGGEGFSFSTCVSVGVVSMFPVFVIYLFIVLFLSYFPFRSTWTDKYLPFVTCIPTLMNDRGGMV